MGHWAGMLPIFTGAGFLFFAVGEKALLRENVFYSQLSLRKKAMCRRVAKVVLSEQQQLILQKLSPRNVRPSGLSRGLVLFYSHSTNFTHLTLLLYSPVKERTKRFKNASGRFKSKVFSSVETTVHFSGSP